MAEVINTSTVVGFGVEGEASKYVIEEDQPLIYNRKYHKTIRVYHGDDIVKTLVTTGTLEDLGPRVEELESFGFAFSGGNEASTPYMLGSGGTVEDIEITEVMFNPKGEEITPTFYYDSDAGVLRASEDCYGLVLGKVTIPFTLYGFLYGPYFREDLGGPFSTFAKSLLYVFGLESGVVATHSIPAVYPINDLSKLDRTELWRVVSYRYVTDETTNNVYEESTGSNKHAFLPSDYQGDEPLGARLRTEEVHEIAYLKPEGYSYTIELETFLVKTAINTPSGFSIPNIGYPHRVLQKTYNELDMDEETLGRIQRALTEREEQGLNESNLDKWSWI